MISVGVTVHDSPGNSARVQLELYEALARESTIIEYRPELSILAHVDDKLNTPLLFAGLSVNPPIEEQGG